MHDILDLSKKFELNLQKANIVNIPTMETKLAVDKSGSMYEEFYHGWVDKTIDLFIAAAMKFDDDGLLEMGFFNHDFESAPYASASDVGTYVKKRHIRAEGGTNYAPVIRSMASVKAPVSGGLLGGLRRLVGKDSAPAKKTDPAYIGMITDGDGQDYHEFVRELSTMDPRNFLQVIVIGDQVTMSRLKSLDGIPNFHWIHFRDPYEVSDDAFYEALCHTKLKAWIDTL